MKFLCKVSSLFKTALRSSGLLTVRWRRRLRYTMLIFYSNCGVHVNIGARVSEEELEESSSKMLKCRNGR